MRGNAGNGFRFYDKKGKLRAYSLKTKNMLTKELRQYKND